MRWLLRWLVSDDDWLAIQSDLAELHELRRRRDGPRAARWWLWRQRLLLPGYLAVDRIRAVIPGRTTMQHLVHDLRHTLRSLVRVPVLSATIVLSVGFGVGATAATIAAIWAVLVNPLPYVDPGSLFWIYTDNPPYTFRFSVVDYRALEADHPTFSAVAAYQSSQVTVTDRALAERVTARSVTGSYFPLLGQKPHLGRLFNPSDDAHREPLAVLTYPYWARKFGRDPSVLGRSLTVDGADFTIIGVLEQSAGPLERNVALFTAERWPVPKRKGPFFTTALARLKPGIADSVAREALRATNTRLFPIWRSSYQDEKATWGLMGLKERVVGSVGTRLLFLLGAVVLVLLIACANAVNLLIARGLHRSRELAIRGALGASRGRLLQHVLVEAAMLSAGAALVGTGVAAGLLQLMTFYGANYIPRIDEIRLAGPALLWVGGLAIASAAMIGLVPALHGARIRADAVLRAGGRSATDGPATRNVRRVLVAAEFALATPLLVAAALTLISLDRLNRVPVGVDTERILTAGVALSGAAYARDTDRAAFWKRALERMEALPGVEAAALSDSRPPRESGQLNNFDLEDRPTPAGQNQPICPWIAASPELFRTVGLTLERGRLLDDRSLREDVIVVDRAWADRFFPGEEVLGRRLKGGGCSSCPWTTVVGVVGNVKWTGLEAPEAGTVYFPFVDFPNAFVMLRTSGDPVSLSLSLHQAVKELDPGLALSNVATGSELVSDALATPRYLSVLIATLALTALLLSIIGIYGVMSYFVQQHTRDIGIRLALGGEPARVRRMIVLQGLQLVLVGVAAGIGAALLANRLMGTVLFGVSPTDLRTMIGVPCGLMMVAVAACLVPARRAAAVDPAEILRES
jgi:putative ABC transport system permease protein